MTRPVNFLLRMVIFLVVAGGGCLLIYEALIGAFLANIYLNGTILLTLLVGIVIDFWTVGRLNREINWIENFRRGSHGAQTSIAAPKLLAPAATMLSERSDRTMTRLSLSTTAMQTLLDGIAVRLDEAREINRYMVGLLVFLGLLGTFWGLLQTVQSVSSVISGIDVGGSDVGLAFEELKLGLEAPLAGMGTAFSSSLFGLAGSLILGFLGLQAGQAQNRFYNDLEEWLSSLTRLGGGSGTITDGEQSVPAYIQALLEQTADSLESLQRTIGKAEESRAASHANIEELSSNLGALTETIRTEQELMLKLAEGQQRLQGVMEKMAAGAADGGDKAAQRHLQNIETHLARMIDQANTGRTETVQEIRSEIRLLARTIAAIAEGDA